jgi:hypothetical protein
MSLALQLNGGWRYLTDGPGSQVWRDKMRILWEYLHRNMEDSRRQRARLYPKTWQKHVQRVVPFIWRNAREMASMKRTRAFVDPVTGLPLPEAVLRVIELVYSEAGVDKAMQAAYGQLVTLNQSTVWLFPNGASLRCVTMPPHDQAVELTDPLAQSEDEVSAWRILVPIEQDPDLGGVRYATARFTASDITWMDEYAAEYPPPFGGTNPFGRIPVVCMRGDDTVSGAWWCYAPDDLLDAQRAINHDMTDLGHIARLQGYSQMYVSGVSAGEAENMDTGPETLAAFGDPTARLDFARPQPDLAGYAATNEQYMRAVISAQGMNPATFLKSAGITALAKKMEQIDRDTERQKYLDELQRGEQRCYDLVRAYVNAVRGVEVLPPAKVELEFREPVLPADPLHDAQALQLQQTLGLIGKVRARAKMDGIGVEEALRRMLADEELDARLMPEVERAVAETVAVEVSDVETEAVAAEASTVQDTALNGAQVASLMDIVAQVSARTMPAEAARLLIETAFPAVNPAIAAQIVASAASFTPAAPVEAAPAEVPSGGV